MSKREAYEARTEELITPILERMQFELVDVEYVKEGATWYLRAYIDKEGGITVNASRISAISAFSNVSSLPSSVSIVTVFSSYDFCPSFLHFSLPFYFDFHY